MSETKQANISEDTNDCSGTRALLVRRLPHAATIVNPERTDAEKAQIQPFIFDIKSKPEENPTAEAQRIKKTTVIFKKLILDSNEPFYPWAIFYINGLGQLKKELLLFPEDNTQEIKDKSLQWLNQIQIPPNDVQFIDVKSGGAFALAKTIEGKLWSYGIKEDGTWDSNNDSWIENPHFNSQDGLIPSSLGPSKIRQFCFELHLAIIILENGAVFAYGPLSTFKHWDNIPDDGFIELTDSTRIQPRFVDEIRGKLSGSQGQYGIFGTFHVVKYFRKADQYLTADGIVLGMTIIINNYEGNEKDQLTPIDPKFFGGEKIVHINHHVWDAYVTESGRVIITRGVYKQAIEIVVELTTPQKVLQLPFPVDQLKTLILTKKTHYTALNKDGRILSIRYEDGSVRDATDYAKELVNADGKGQGLKIKHFGHAQAIYFFLFD
ncbi:MAG: hypothetical protein EZS28_024929 [Streblomastix strix]|uniref:Uncharacterized protein n=1 Tax=Streblomastix strix TaxID=222440 RepID=A0A5J4VAL9_9EUKA|nr:MAG: hypothetical protein EZS28_024929 [Streblomastix strix]